MSSPAQKARPVPVNTTTRTASSIWAWSSISTRSRFMPPVHAVHRSGRSKVTGRMPGSERSVSNPACVVELIFGPPGRELAGGSSRTVARHGWHERDGADQHRAVTDLPVHDVYAVKYAERDAVRSEHFIGGADPHDAPMPMDYFVWVVRGRRPDVGRGHRLRPGDADARGDAGCSGRGRRGGGARSASMRVPSRTWSSPTSTTTTSAGGPALPQRPLPPPGRRRWRS